jgi:putative endonuclease
MPTQKRKLGNAGEDYCVKYLIDLGYQILSRNFISPFGEIDIIVENQTSLVFIEVKTRTDESVDHAMLSITASKQKKITKTAMFFLQSYNNPNVIEHRFDVIILQIAPEGEFELKHIQNAFSPAEVGDFFP